MADEKVWGKSSSLKLYRGLWLLIVLAPISEIIGRIIDHRPLTMYLLIYLAGISTALYFILGHWILSITTDDNGIRIRGLFKNHLIRWDAVTDFYLTDQVVIIRYDTASPITIHTQFMKESAQFIELLNLKINKTEPVECLQCGTLIGRESNHCPTCGWSWEKTASLPDQTEE